MFEKYHAQMVGEPGGGGEYVVQEGFGWSNGVILYVLKHFGQQLRAPEKCADFLIEKPLRIADPPRDAWVFKKVEMRRNNVLPDDTKVVGLEVALCALFILVAVSVYFFFIRRKKEDQK